MLDIDLYQKLQAGIERGGIDVMLLVKMHATSEADLNDAEFERAFDATLASMVRMPSIDDDPDIDSDLIWIVDDHIYSSGDGNDDHRLNVKIDTLKKDLREVFAMRRLWWYNIETKVLRLTIDLYRDGNAE